MKTNLGKAYQTDAAKEMNGTWLDIDEGVRFLVSRFGGKNQSKIKKLQSTHIKPYARQIQLGTMDPEKEREVYVKVFVEACMLGWEGVLDDKDNVIEFDKKTAVALFKELPDLFDDVVSIVTEPDIFKEDLGNSLSHT